jgi:hypothetical protein
MSSICESLIKNGAKPMGLKCAAFDRGTLLKTATKASYFCYPYGKYPFIFFSPLLFPSNSLASVQDICGNDGLIDAFSVMVRYSEANPEELDLNRLDPRGDSIVIRLLMNGASGKDVLAVTNLLPHLATLPDAAGVTPALWALACVKDGLYDLLLKICELTDYNCVLDEVPESRYHATQVGCSFFHLLLSAVNRFSNLRTLIYCALGTASKRDWDIINKQTNNKLQALPVTYLLMNSSNNTNPAVMDTLLAALIYNGADLTIQDYRQVVASFSISLPSSHFYPAPCSLLLLPSTHLLFLVLPSNPFCIPTENTTSLRC